MNGPLVPDHLVGERIAGRFVIERAIGQGPLSIAFRATDELLQRRVTVKLFHPQHPDDVAVVDSQLELAKAVARLNHPNIVTVIDRGEHDGLPFVVLEYVRGENLDERLDRWAPLAVSEVLGYGIAIARALAYAHSHGVVHGNLRPGNVLINEEREVKLVDFGGGSYLASLTGTDPYLAPERRALDMTHTELGPEEDIHALGVLLFVALTEAEPLAGITAADLQLLRPDASPKLAATVVRAMAEAPEARPASMHELAAELAAARSGARAESSLMAEHGLGGERAAGGVGAGVASVPVTPFDTNGATGAYATSDDFGTSQHTAVVSGIPEVDDPELAASARDRDRRNHRHLRSARRARLVGWSMLLIPVAVLVLIGMMIAGERGHDSTASTQNGQRANVGAAIAVPIAGAGSLDPQGDKFEHENEAANVHDGKNDTTWETEGYTTGLGKPGVGLWVRTRRPVAATGVRMNTDLEGFGYTVYASDQPEATLSAWTKVSKPADAVSGKVTVIDTKGKAYSYWLIWVTRLSIDVDDSNKMRARIGELAVLAPTDA